MATSIFGRVVHRVEDPRFLTGRSRYVDDPHVEGALRAVFVRSIMSHARLIDVDVAEAHLDPPLSPERVRRAIQQARS